MDYYDKNPGVAITAFITVPMRNWMKEESYKNGIRHMALWEPLSKARKRGAVNPDVSDRQIIDLYNLLMTVTPVPEKLFISASSVTDSSRLMVFPINFSGCSFPDLIISSRAGYL